MRPYFSRTMYRRKGAAWQQAAGVRMPTCDNQRRDKAAAVLLSGGITAGGRPIEGRGVR